LKNLDNKIGYGVNQIAKGLETNQCLEVLYLGCKLFFFPFFLKI